MTTYYIYTLADPRTNIIRYVGCSTNPKARLSQHLTDVGNSRKTQWMSELRIANLRPILNVIDSCTDFDTIVKKEKEYYKKYHSEWMVAEDPEKIGYKGTFNDKKLRKRKQFIISLLEGTVEVMDKIASKRGVTRTELLESLILEEQKRIGG